MSIIALLKLIGSSIQKFTRVIIDISRRGEWEGCGKGGRHVFNNVSQLLQQYIVCFFSKKGDNSIWCRENTMGLFDALSNLDRVKRLLHVSFNFGPLLYFVNPSTTIDNMSIYFFLVIFCY